MFNININININSQVYYLSVKQLKVRTEQIFCTSPPLRVSNEIRGNFAKMTNNFRQTYFRLSLNIKYDFRYLSKKLFHYASRRMIVWGSHSWLPKLVRGWCGKNVFFFLENILPCANILGVPNYMTKMMKIYLNLIYMQLCILWLISFLLLCQSNI